MRPAVCEGRRANAPFPWKYTALGRYPHGGSLAHRATRVPPIPNTAAANEEYPATPLVSVIIPAFNAERYIVETLDSLFAQTYPNIEVIVVDDGSADRTRAIVESYGKPIKYLYQVNSGGCS